MMEEEDPRVKELQTLAWSLNTLTNKPGGKLPDIEKRKAYKVTSRAIELCTNCTYLEVEDFVSRAAKLTAEIEAKKRECKDIEESEIARLSGKCYRATPNAGGSYTVGSKVSSEALAAAAAVEAAMITTARGDDEASYALTAKEVVARCADDPEALWLSDLGLKDTDMQALSEGLRKAGATLTSVDLSHNAIADAGVQKLVTTLAAGACPKLTELWLSGNSFGPLGEQMLTGGLKALRKGLTVRLGPEGDQGSASIPPTTSPAVSSTSAPAAKPQAPATAQATSAAILSPSAPPPVAAGGAGNGGSGGAPVAVEVVEEESGDVRITIPLPEGATARDVDLDISERRLLVTSSADASASLGSDVADAGAFRPLFDVRLPRPVDPESAKAAFSKKRRSLTVTLHAK